MNQVKSQKFSPKIISPENIEQVKVNSYSSVPFPILRTRNNSSGSIEANSHNRLASPPRTDRSHMKDFGSPSRSPAKNNSQGVTIITTMIQRLASPPKRQPKIYDFDTQSGSINTTQRSPLMSPRKQQVNKERAFEHEQRHINKLKEVSERKEAMKKR